MTTDDSSTQTTDTLQRWLQRQPERFISHRLDEVFRALRRPGGPSLIHGTGRRHRT